MPECLFCKIARNELPSHKIMESEKYLAFLDLFPNRRGQTLVIPKKHFGSYPFHMPDEDYLGLMEFTKRVAIALDESLKTFRTVLVFEGMDVDHVHAKLYPLYKMDVASSSDEEFYETYRGFVTTKHGPKADEVKLAGLAKMVRDHIESR